MTRAIAFAVAVLSLARPAAAAADKTTDAMISRGLELRRQGKDLEALTVFQRADMLAPTPRTVGQLGLVESALFHWGDAEEHLAAALASAQDPWVRKNHSLLEQALSLSKSHIGQIQLSGPAGSIVTVGGKTIGTLPHTAPVRVSEGTAIVTATAPGFKQFIMSVPVQAGMQTPLTIALDPIDIRSADNAPTAATALAPVPKPEDGRSRGAWRPWTGATLVAVGSGALAWGIVWIVLDGRTASGSCTADAPADCQPVYNTKTAGWILAGAGAATAAVGGVVLYSSRSSGNDVTIGLGPTSFVLGGKF